MYTATVVQLHLLNLQLNDEKLEVLIITNWSIPKWVDRDTLLGDNRTPRENTIVTVALAGYQRRGVELPL